jgi:hypothetical protein
MRPLLPAIVLLAILGAPRVTSGIAQPLPPPRPAETKNPSSGSQLSEPGQGQALETQLSECRGILGELGVRFEPQAIARDGDCVVEDPVRLSGLPGGVLVEPPALMTCRMAEALARWTTEVVTVQATNLLQARPSALVLGTTYECRPQRNGAKLSEHAFGNGVDLVGIRFPERAAVTIGMHPADSAAVAFETAIRTGACAHFTTVLGPGSDADHGDHLHLDLRSRKGGYRICQ